MISTIIFAILGIFSFILLHFVWKFLKKTLMYLSFPGPPVDWLLRHKVNDFTSPYDELLEYKTKWNLRYPRICRYFIGPIGYICVTHPESIQLIMKSKPPKHPMYKQMLFEWLGDGLLLSGGKKWFRHRRMLTPAFHFTILESFMSVYTKSTNVMLGLWEETAQRDGYVVLQDFIPYLTLDILIQCIGSLETGCQIEKENVEYVRDICDLTKLSIFRYLNFLYSFNWYFYRTAHGKIFKQACARSHAFIRDLVLSRRQSLLNKAPETDANLDFLSILLTTTDESGKGLTDEEICDEVNTFVFEGHDTTSTGMIWVLYFLAKYPDYQDMCRKEILENTAGDGVTYKDLPKFEFLTMFIKESLRLRPPVHTVARETNHPLVLDEYPIPNGTLVQISYYLLHWNPEFWPEPMKFDPYRFSVENELNRDPYAYLPFSVGERNCIGQFLAMHEIKTVMSMILKSFKLNLHPSISDSPIKLEKNLLLKAETPINIILQKVQ